MLFITSLRLISLHASPRNPDLSGLSLLGSSGSGCGCRRVHRVYFGGRDTFPVLHGEHLVAQAIQETIVVHNIIPGHGCVHDRFWLLYPEHQER